jgi:aquaporin Z
MDKYVAEFFGTFCLLFIGVGSIVAGGFGAELPLGLIGIGLAFGLTVTAMVYTIGPVSGCHLNPAVTVGVWLAGRMPAGDVLPYVLAQVVGAFAGALLLYVIMLGKVGGFDVSTVGFGANAYDPLEGHVWWSAFLIEVVATFIFVAVILGVTHPLQPTALAGVVIGLTLAILHFAFVPVSGNSVNPARSLAPALIERGTALAQLWIYIVAPLIGGALAGLLAKRNTYYLRG